MVESPDEVRARIGALLASGLETDWRTRAYEDVQIAKVIGELRALAPGDLEERLRIAGFTEKPCVGPEDPEIEQSCLTGMYYEPHRRWCALAEMDLSVEPAWSCNLWRI